MINIIFLIAITAYYWKRKNLIKATNQQPYILLVPDTLVTSNDMNWLAANEERVMGRELLRSFFLWSDVSSMRYIPSLYQSPKEHQSFLWLFVHNLHDYIKSNWFSLHPTSIFIPMILKFSWNWIPLAHRSGAMNLPELFILAVAGQND